MSILTSVPNPIVTTPPTPEVSSAVQTALAAVRIKAAIICQDGHQVYVFFKQNQRGCMQYLDEFETFKLPVIQQALDSYTVDFDPFYWQWWGMNMLRLVITVGGQ